MFVVKEGRSVFANGVTFGGEGVPIETLAIILFKFAGDMENELFEKYRLKEESGCKRTGGGAH